MLNTKAETKTDPNYTAETLKCHRTRKTTNGKVNKCFNKKNSAAAAVQVAIIMKRQLNNWQQQ